MDTVDKTDVTSTSEPVDEALKIFLMLTQDQQAWILALLKTLSSPQE